MKNIFFLGFMLLSSVHISAGEAELAIIIDFDQENETSINDPITQNLALAILSERCPIITTVWLFNTLEKRKRNFNKNPNDVHSAKNNSTEIIKFQPTPSQQTDLLCAMTQFEKWSIYRDSQTGLVFLIPESYKNFSGIDTSIFEKVPATPENILNTPHFPPPHERPVVAG